MQRRVHVHRRGNLPLDAHLPGFRPTDLWTGHLPRLSQLHKPDLPRPDVPRLGPADMLRSQLRGADLLFDLWWQFHLH